MTQMNPVHRKLGNDFMKFLPSSPPLLKPMTHPLMLGTQASMICQPSGLLEQSPMSGTPSY